MLKTASVIFIEFIRGVPLISLAAVLEPDAAIVPPIDFERPADLTLAIIVITGFSAAYIAEIVRGGLQAVPKGQTEAAQASGMSAASVQRLIVLPQALRAVIPAMVGQFISLFKDTSLLSIIGILEFLAGQRCANAQNEFVGKGLATIDLPVRGDWLLGLRLHNVQREPTARNQAGSWNPMTDATINADATRSVVPARS